MIGRTALALGLTLILAGCATDDPLPGAAPDLLVLRSGGRTTTMDRSEHAFSRSARNLGQVDRKRFADGDMVFDVTYTGATGLGPDFNATGCGSCHVDGGRVEVAIGNRETLAAGPVLHVSAPGAGVDEEPRGLPGYGTRLQTAAIDGDPEATIFVTWELEDGRYPDGTPFELRSPTVSVAANRGPLPAGTQISLRIPPHLPGVGLLQAISLGDILAGADPDDSDGDGISGVPNRVRNSAGDEAIGRFGWKAEHPDLLHQVVAALRDDLGIVSGPGTAGADVELGEHDVADLAFYVEALAVPAGRDLDDPDVVAGADLFEQTGCATCHTAHFTTAAVGIEGLSGQRIAPFSDLLLHDMGPGLADDRPVYAASGREWRTAPLWGIGLLGTVNGQVDLLHDGRARSVEEAILWHGGEARGSTDRFMHLSTTERRQLIAFVQSR